MPEYDVINVSGHESFDVHSDFNGNLENVLFDQTGSGAAATVRAESGSWTIRNVGFMGRRDNADGQTLRLAASGTGVVENVYLGDGCESGTDANGIWCAGDHHSGVLKIRYTHVAKYPDNGYYVSDSSLSGFGQNGDVHIENSYSLNNNICGFRIGGRNHHVKDSVSAVTSSSEVPVHANGGHNARCGRMENVNGNLFENVDLLQTQGWSALQMKDGANGTARNCRIEGSIDEGEGSVNLVNTSRSGATSNPPEGVPRTAQQAASGEGGPVQPDPVTVSGSTTLSPGEANLSTQTSVRTVHSGYNGQGFIDLEPPDGAYARWLLDVQTPGDYTLSVRHSNGAGQRDASLTIGDNSEGITFPGTGGWNTWQNIEREVTLPAGETTIGIETTGNDAGQIDYVTLEPIPDDPEPPDPEPPEPEPEQSSVGLLFALGLAGAAVRRYQDEGEL